MGKFSTATFRKETKQAFASFRNIARNAAMAKFTSLKESMLEEFDNDNVTKEIEAGPDANNLSNTLKGKGNLFSFIGFPSDSSPIDDVRQILISLIQMDSQPVIQETSNSFIFKFKVKIPTLASLYVLTPLPWESGKSWLRGVEKGISGFGRYMYWKTLPFPPSRSGTGVQTNNILRNSYYKPVPYMSKILAGFRNNLK